MQRASASDVVEGVVREALPGGRGGVVGRPHEGAVLVRVSRRFLKEFVKRLIKGFGRRGATVRYSTGVATDYRPVDGSFRMAHVLAVDKLKTYLIVEADAPPPHPRIPSITPELPAAGWAEREAADMVGVEFPGHPSPGRLVLPEGWPEGVHPLRKDFPYDRKLGVAEALEGGTYVRGFSSPSPHSPGVEGRPTALIPLGPYHPALHEPEYFEIFVDGERIVGARYRGFFVHRGMEKLAESRMTIDQVPFLAERICGICGYTHACAYCQAVEAAARIEVPERALYIRSILLEIERLHSHLLWFGVAFHLLGFETGFMAMWRVREAVMRVAEALTGNRKTYGMNLVGGVRRDIDVRRAAAVVRMLDEVERGFKEFCGHALKLGEVVERVRGVGVLSREDAVKLGAVGPHARASGLAIDVRVDHPYAAYGFVDVEVPVRDEGDVLARILVRYEEVLESVRLVREFLRGMPAGGLRAEVRDLPPLRVGVGATEAPRGEDVHYVVTGRGNTLYRWRPRAPSYMNIPTVPVMLEGERLANAPIIIASIDPCFSCTDHAVVIDVRFGVRRPLKALVGGGGPLG